MGKRTSKIKSKKETRKKRMVEIKQLNPKYIMENKDTLDFDKLYKTYPFDENLVISLKDKIDWNILFIYNKNIDRLFFYNNEEFLNWDKISMHKNLPATALEKCPDRLNWTLVCRYSQMDENILEAFYKYLDFEEISINQTLSPEFISKHINDFKLYMEEIGDNQRLTEDFMREYKDIVDWRAISRSQKLSESFLDEMKDYVDWTWVSYKQKLSSRFIETHMDYVNFYSLIKRDAYIPKAIQRTSFYEICKLYTKRKRFIEKKELEEVG